MCNCNYQLILLCSVALFYLLSCSFQLRKNRNKFNCISELKRCLVWWSAAERYWCGHQQVEKATDSVRACISTAFRTHFVSILWDQKRIMDKWIVINFVCSQKVVPLPLTVWFSGVQSFPRQGTKNIQVRWTSGSAMAERPRNALVSRNSATTKYPYRMALFAWSYV